MPRTLAIENYRSLRDLVLPLTSLNVVTGGNGTGKSSLYRALRRRLRQVKAERGDDGITLPESAALVRLDRGGPATSSALARQEQISPQSMGATLAGLEARRLVGRQPDPHDGRRAVISITEAGREVLRDRRGKHAELLAEALATGFSPGELDTLRAAAPLLERLAERI